ncbi:uncharacterized protein BDR25DRAFT_300341 [Lindgomyces ingoldianus]|uniref:Uncharacterized protein n=1 Tax=Lindgomyces ingoldianus TaxID=673940 RepID=A0ACB6RAW1_9PLEO|nr:uncharacterized protein BDR25DRAFT_300341 [Lindgomyces ingoldianus]KAF2476237.1 hypothetical protein BDR25DRAFT_300341 [Lindgomyces ingoldianus]
MLSRRMRFCGQVLILLLNSQKTGFVPSSVLGSCYLHHWVLLWNIKDCSPSEGINAPSSIHPAATYPTS